MADTASVYAAITKADKQPDGTLLVRGVATDSTLDIDEQVCDPAWLKQAMPEWFRWGNIREQHSSIAAGVAEEYEEKDGAHAIVARVVDPNSVKKVETGVLKGFSIGIRRPRIAADKTAAGGRIVGGQIVEVSLVDRPANPACTLVLAKSARPGMTVKSTDLSPVDEGGFLVRVEEYSEKAAGDEPATTEPAADAPATDSGAPDAPAPDVAGEGDAADEGAGAPATDSTEGADAAPDAPAGDEPAVEAPADAESATEAASAPDEGTPAEAPAVAEPAEAATAATGEVGDPEPAVVPDAEAASLATGKATGLDADVLAAVVREVAKALGHPLPDEPATAPAAETVLVGEHGPELDVPATEKAAEPETPTDAATAPQDAADGLALLAKWAGRLGRLDLMPDVSKAAGTHDPAVLAAIRNGILGCIVAEAQEAMTGEREEWDIARLLDSLRSFLSWWDCEASHAEVPAPHTVAGDGTAALGGLDAIPADTDMGGGVVEAAAGGATVVKFLAADGEKAPAAGGCDGKCCDACGAASKAADTDSTTETPAPAGAGENAATDTVKAPAAESVNAHLLDVIEGLTERLERVEKAAAPGGPVRVRPTAAERVSRQGDSLRAEVTRLRALAKSAGDRGIAAEYDRRADEAEAALRTLTATPAATA